MGQETLENPDMKSPSLQHGKRNGLEETVCFPVDLQAPYPAMPRELQAPHSVVAPKELQAPHCMAPSMTSSSSLAHLAARSASPTRSHAVSSVELPAVLRNSGSAPALPPLPPLVAPGRGAGPVRSKSVVAVHDSKGETFQPLQRGQ